MDNFYKTGIALDIKNVIKQERLPKKWDFLYDYLTGKSKKLKILDVGCGTGSIMLFLLKKHYRHIIGLEYNEEAYKNIVKSHPQLKIVNGTAEDLSRFKDETFDLVYCSHVLEHLPNPTTAVEEARKVLKKNGAYIIGVPNGNHLNDIIMKIIQIIFYKRTDHLQRFSKNSISNLLENKGFKIIKLKARKDSLSLLLNCRIKKYLFFSKSFYFFLKRFYFEDISYDILSIKK